MIGSSVPEYIFIRIAIALLRLVTPLCIVYTFASWYLGGWIYSRWFGYYALVECAFYLLVYLPRNWYLQRAVERPPILPREQREELFQRCFSSMRENDMATGWFYSAPMSSIKRGNMTEWLCWALFGAHKEDLRKEWEAEIEGYVAEIEKYQGCKYEDGWDAKLSCMKVSLDPVVMLHRPFLWYMIVALVDTITGGLLVYNGFHYYNNQKSLFCFPPRVHALYARRSSDPDIVYWYRPHRSKTKTPILFLHGIGIGLWPYTPFFSEILASDPDVGILAIENLSISMRIYYPPLTRDQMLRSLTRILDHHRLQRVVVASHSYGTILHAHMLRDPALHTRVASSMFIDPIPFMLHLPAVAYNFVYRVPRSANEWQLWYFASRDPDIARALARHFFWHENLLWKEELEGSGAAVVLGGKDQIVDAPEVRRYLTGKEEIEFRWKDKGLEVLYYPELDHQTVLSTKERRKPLVEIMRRFVRNEEQRD